MTSERAIPGGMAPETLSSMFQAVGGLRNYRAAAAMLACFLVALVLLQLVGGGLGMVVSVLIGLVALIAAFTGIHASGILLMDQARGLPGRSILEAIVYGLMCVPKTVVLMLALVLAAIAVNLVMALMFFVSKMPGVGPLLFALAFPAAVLLSGLMSTALLMGLALSLAAIWEGATISGAILKTVAVLRHRLVEAVLLLVVVMVMSWVVAGFVFGILMLGIWPATGMAVNMLDVSIDNLQGLGSIFGGSSRGMRHGGYMMAGLFGAGVLWALALTLVMQVWLLGLNLAYLRVSEGVDASATEGALQARFADARRKAAEMGQKAKEATERARSQAEQALEQRRATAEAAKSTTAAALGASASAPAEVAQGSDAPDAASTARAAATAASARTATATSVCPACQVPVSADDVFCGSCGHRLKG